MIRPIVLCCMISVEAGTPREFCLVIIPVCKTKFSEMSWNPPVSEVSCYLMDLYVQISMIKLSEQFIPINEVKTRNYI